MTLTSKTFFPWWLKNSADFHALLLDIDGTMVSKDRELPGASTLLEQLRTTSFPFYFLTNDGDNSREEKSTILKNAGLDVSAHEIVSCSLALNNFAEQQQAAGKLYFVMGDLGVPCYAENAGLKVTRDVNDLTECQGVIVGEGEYNWHKVITAVINYFLHNPHGHLLVPNPDTYWPDRHGKIGIGAGGKTRFITMVLQEAGVKLEPLYLGKPYPMIYEYALKLIGERFYDGRKPDYQKVLMLGDSLHSDINGANNIGLKSGLLLSGITTPTLLQSAEKAMRPIYVFGQLI